MTIWNLGSINADHVYALPRIPVAGETLAATGLSRGLGGKGANMSVACARAGAKVRHLGAVGADGAWAVERLRSYGVDTDGVVTLDAPGGPPTGHAIIAVDGAGENMIVVFPGANRQVPEAHVAASLAGARPGDWFLAQNETNGQVEGAQAARARGLRVAYAAAPFDREATRAMLPLAHLLVLNEVEAGQLREATGRGPGNLGVAHVVVTLGAEGALWLHGGEERRVPAVRVVPVDTTGAGDTFTGFLLAGLNQGLGGGRDLEDAAGRPDRFMEATIRLAARAAALKVTRAGAADAIPARAEAEAFDG